MCDSWFGYPDWQGCQGINIQNKQRGEGMKLNWGIIGLLFLFLICIMAQAPQATNYYLCYNYCTLKRGTTTACSSTTTYCTSSQYCSGGDTCWTGVASCTVGACAYCGACNGAGTCIAATCGNQASGGQGGCSGTNYCDGTGTTSSACKAKGGTGATCCANGACLSNICSGGYCLAAYQSGTNKCGYYTGTSSSCGSANTWCGAGKYLSTTQSCGSGVLSCTSETSANSCNVCGDCAVSADTCNAVSCGTTNSYGCGSGNYCSGGIGTGSCNAPFALGQACNCTLQCASPNTCVSNLCASASTPAVITITLNYPNDNVWNTTTKTITHYYTPSITGTNAGYLNCTLYTNYTGSWAMTAGNSTPITNNALNSIQYTYAADKANIQWNIYCWNASGSPSNYSATNRTIKIDTALPTTTASAVKNDSASYTFGQWTNSSYVNVTLSCSDATAQCLITKYCTDATNTCDPKTGTTYTAPVQISTPGTSYIRYNSTDNAGNIETVNSKTIMIDTTAPTTTASAVKNDSAAYTWGSWTNSTYVNVTLSCADTGGSGCSVTNYCNASTNDCTPSTPYSSAVQINVQGTSYFRYNSTDTISNNEAVNSKTIMVDSVPPSQVMNLINSSTGTTWVNISWTASTDTGGSGINTYLIWRNETNVANTTNVYYNDSGLSAGATYNYTVGAIDNAGNYGQNSSNLIVTLFNISTSLTQSAAPSSPQLPSTNVTFNCNYSNAADNSAITGATVYLNLNAVNYSATYNSSSTNYTYWNNSMPNGGNTWYCIANKTNYQSQTGASQGYTITLGTTLSTDASTYSGCGAVFYRVSLYDQNSRLTNSYITTTFVYPDSSTAFTQSSLYPNNGTGVYTGVYQLNSTSPVGTWLLKIVENFGVIAGKNFFVSST